MNMRILKTIYLRTKRSALLCLGLLILASFGFAQTTQSQTNYMPAINQYLLSDGLDTDATPKPNFGSTDFSDVENWDLTANRNNNDVGLAFDGDLSTRWTTQQTQRANQYYLINFNSLKTFDQILLDTTGDNEDYPREYQVQISSDGTNFQTIASGSPTSGPLITITFPRQTAQYLRIEQIGSSNRYWWSIREMTISFGNIPDTPDNPTTPDDPLDGLHPDITRVADIPLEDIPREPRGEAWKDSYSVGDRCYCDTTFDHNIGSLIVSTSQGNMTVFQACAAIGPGPGSNGNPIYNDVQCGNGPANDAGDEDYCPGRVDIGREGCPQIGPRFNFN